MKLLIAALLAVFSTSVLAEWTEVDGNGDFTAYADRSTIRKSGNRVKMWDLTDFKVVKTVQGKSRLSGASQQEYDCKEETIKVLTFIWYSKNMGVGEVVYSSGTMHEEPIPMSPSSIGEALFKVACGK